MDINVEKVEKPQHMTKFEKSWLQEPLGKTPPILKE